MRLDLEVTRQKTTHSTPLLPPLATFSATLADDYRRIRSQTLALIESLSPEDMVVQSMPDSSPTKWHLAHTTWFFEAFILKAFHNDFRWFDPSFNYLFNSYYESVGLRHERPKRGMLTRPALEDIMSYRRQIDHDMLVLIASQANDISQQLSALIQVGLHHEMQHQELISTDILHLMWQNPLLPKIYCNNQTTPPDPRYTNANLRMIPFNAGDIEVGGNSNHHAFAYDCEGPRHTIRLEPFALSHRLISNREWLEFIADGGYTNSLLWLSDGWVDAQKNGWKAPLYWLKQDEQWHQYGLNGLQAIDLNSPVCHINYYEADAFARWAQKRLPHEHEWEHAASTQKIQGNFLENGHFRTQACSTGTDLTQMYGDVWQWTQSPFTAYRGFKASENAIGEYNGKFMANQYVLRGGSCVTPRQQLRPSYRNFFHPHHRWQFSGLRLAQDN